MFLKITIIYAFIYVIKIKKGLSIMIERPFFIFMLYLSFNSLSHQ